KMAQQQQSKQAAQQLAKSLSKAAQACKNCQKPGDAQGESSAAAAAAALGDAQCQLSEMEMSEHAMGELQDQSGQRNESSEGAGQGNCAGMGEPSYKVGDHGPNLGRGYGAPTGVAPTAHNSKPTKTDTKPQGGQVIGQQLIDGPMVSGQANA